MSDQVCKNTYVVQWETAQSAIESADTELTSWPLFLKFRGGLQQDPHGEDGIGGRFHQTNSYRKLSRTHWQPCFGDPAKLTRLPTARLGRRKTLTILRQTAGESGIV